MIGVKYVSCSQNSKIAGRGQIDATYVSIESSCPSTCSLKDDKTCYAQLSFVGMHVKRLDVASKGMTAIQIARQEAKAIDNSYDGGKVPDNCYLRLHVSGDCKTISAAKAVNNAAGRWRKRGGAEVFSYTHSWDKVLRENWSNVSMLASVDSIEQAEFAKQNGYAVALVVSEHISDKAYVLPGSDIKWIPCKSQISGVACTECKICMRADELFRTNHGVAFSAHGVKKNAIKRRLNVVKS